MQPCNCYTSLIKFYIYIVPFAYLFIVPFQLFAYLFLSGKSKLKGNRQIDFLSLSKLRFGLFLMLETFLVFLRYIVYNMLFYNIIDMFFKVQFGINSNTKQCKRSDGFCGYITDLQCMWFCISQDHKLKFIRICFH